MVTTHVLSPVTTINTFLISSSDAQLEAIRQLNMRKVRRDFVQVVLKSKALAAIPTLGAIVQVTYPRYGYNAGKLFICVGFEMHLDTDDITIYLWG